jgi:aspartate/methionine/tyrosine aminotransferase
MPGETSSPPTCPRTEASCFARLPRGVEAQALADRLRRKHAMLIVPGHFFEAPDFFRVSVGIRQSRLVRGLHYISDALDYFS